MTTLGSSSLFLTSSLVFDPEGAAAEDPRPCPFVLPPLPFTPVKEIEQEEEDIFTGYRT